MERMKLQRELYFHAEALRSRAKAHIDTAPGEAYIDRLMADDAERLADRLGMLGETPGGTTGRGAPRSKRRRAWRRPASGRH